MRFPDNVFTPAEVSGVLKQHLDDTNYKLRNIKYTTAPIHEDTMQQFRL